ncbi:MAG: type IA DNA topoisomerase [Lachnospiraceae bacterium]|nr:type IA DNA topoisomerase [Lachnospiraceae bacterium]
MGRSLFIAEKPSVAQEFAKALPYQFSRKDGYMEAPEAVVTWCVGHLVTMSYPEEYDPALKQWRLETIPFLPEEFRYEVIPGVAKQFQIVKGLLCREDVDCIYVCTDSGREGEYIYRLVDQMAGVPEEKERRRVWIDSQTEEEILRGIKEAKPLAEYNALSDAAYLRAKEDYLMGINFSRVLTLKYGNSVRSFLKAEKNQAISVGRVMTCVLGMVVRREREIRAFVKTPFYRVLSKLSAGEAVFEAEFRAVKGSKYEDSPKLYKENGFRKKEDAMALITALNLPEGMVFEEITERDKQITVQRAAEGLTAIVEQIEKKQEKKNPPLLFNLAELQNECAKLFKISPDETLKIVQELYEKKLVSYPRTDARVLSTAVAKEIVKNISGLKQYTPAAGFAEHVLQSGSYKGLEKTRYVNDKQITDHYAIIPTGQGISALSSVSTTAKRVYAAIVKRFLSIFYPPAVYRKVALTVKIGEESFFASFKVLAEEGYLVLYQKPAAKAGTDTSDSAGKEEKDGDGKSEGEKQEDSEAELTCGAEMLEALKDMKKGSKLPVALFSIREGETAAPKRYNSGSLILAMENAGQFIEDEELRAQIKGSGIGTSATRAEILNKLVKIEYLALNKKTQIITPTLLGEIVFEVVNASIRSLLNAELTASWEKGLTYVAEGSIGSDEYMGKLESFVRRMTDGVKELNNQSALYGRFSEVAGFYRK